MQKVNLEKLIPKAVKQELALFDGRKKYPLSEVFFNVQGRIRLNYPQIDRILIRWLLIGELLSNHKRMLSDEDFHKLCALWRRNSDQIQAANHEAMFYDMGWNEIEHAPF